MLGGADMRDTPIYIKKTLKTEKIGVEGVVSQLGSLYPSS